MHTQSHCLKGTLRSVVHGTFFCNYNNTLHSAPFRLQTSNLLLYQENFELHQHQLSQLLRSNCCHGIQINGARVHAALPSADAGAVPASIQLLNPARLLAADCTAPYHGDVVTAVFLKMRVCGPQPYLATGKCQRS